MRNQFLKTLSNIAQISKSFEIDLDEQGNLRTITSSRKEGLFTEQLQLRKAVSDRSGYRKTCISTKVFGKDQALCLSKRLLDLSIIQKALQLNDCKLKPAMLTPFAFGYRVFFKQIAQWQGEALFVRGGGVSIAMDKEGRIISLSSTLQYGQSVARPKSVIEKIEAVKIALASCKRRTILTKAELMLAQYDGQLIPVYEICLLSQAPRIDYIFIISANSGKIISQNNKPRLMHFLSEIKAKAISQTPDANKPISAQTSKVIINSLPDPKVLKNDYFEMLIGTCAKPVKINADGTYCYGIREAEFAAVSVFLSLMNQMQLYLELGLWQPKRPLPVVVNDPFLPDNAYFDPKQYDIHLGVGTGIRQGGLNRNIAFDLGVVNHEFGHAAVFLQSIGGDLPGKQGEAINEAVADVLGTLVMDYLTRIKESKKKGGEVTAADLQADERIIGKYALPPFGIRSQKNNKCYPKDLVGEAHADGLIIGGAIADLLVSMVGKQDSDIECQLKLFVQMNLMALALLPGYKVSFVDMLRALITADQQISAGEYRRMIEQCFAKHGIVFGIK